MKRANYDEIGAILVNAIVFDPNHENGEAMDADSLYQSIAQFFELLKKKQIEYLLVGGVALLQYVEGRNTEDIDLIMALSSLQQIPGIEITEETMYFRQARYKSLKIDILLTQNPLFKHVLSTYGQRLDFRGNEIRVVSVEGLLLLKLYALPSLYRQGNFSRVGLYENDVATLIQAYRPDTANLIQVLSKHVSATDLKEIQNILAEIHSRIERFNQSSTSD